MRNISLFSSLLILLLIVSITAFGQYTGVNPDIAGSKVVVASDSITGTGVEPGKAVDGDPLTYASIPGDAPAFIQINLGSYHIIDGFSIDMPNAGELPLEYTFQVGAYGATWTDLLSENISAEGIVSHDVNYADPIRFVRIAMSDKDALASFTEISVFGFELQPPISPTARPGTNITATSFTAEWSPLDNIDGYWLILAKDAGFTNLVPASGEFYVGPANSWNISGLDPATTYYYKVRAVNLAGSSNFGNTKVVTTEIGSQTITFDALDAVTYGDSEFILDATASSGLPVSYTSSNETVATISGDTLSITGFGTTSIIASQDGDTQYLAASPVARDLVVNKKTLSVINASVDNKVYDGTTYAVVSGATLDGVVGSDDVSLTGADEGVFVQTNVGAGIAVSTSMDISGSDIANYSFLAPTGLMADITAKELLVTADDKSREECASNPVFTFTYSGFVGSEDESVLDSKPLAASDADESSADGTYDITVSGGSAANYSVTYISGTLTVMPDLEPPTLEVKNTMVQLDASNNAAITEDDVVVSAADNCSIAGTTLSQFIFTDSDIGDVNVDVTVSDASGNETTKTAVVTIVGSVGMKDSEGLKVSVYPNPTYGQVYLELSNSADELAVMDITGKTVLRKMNLGSKVSIDLTDYHSGIYVIKMKFGEEVQYFKVVKK